MKLIPLLLACVIATTAADCTRDELALRWNQFARHANTRLQSFEASPEKRAQDKRKLSEEWDAVLRCDCF